MDLTLMYQPIVSSKIIVNYFKWKSIFHFPYGRVFIGDAMPQNSESGSANPTTGCKRLIDTTYRG